MPYPLGHAALCPVNCICCLFSCQVLSLILTSFVRTFLCVKQNVDHRGIRTPNLLIRSQRPYPLGHASCQLYLLLVQLPSVVPCIDSISKKFSLCQAKSLQQRGSTPQSSDSKSDAFSVEPCGHASCQSIFMLFVQLPSVIPCIDSIPKKLFPFQEKVDHRGIRTPNLLIRSQTPYPLGHASCQSIVSVICSVAKCYPLYRLDF